MSRVMLASLALVVVCAALSGQSAASPLHRASVSLGYAGFTIDEETSADGGVLNLEYERFFSEAMAVRVAAGGGYFAADENSKAGYGVVGLSYTIDTLRYMPYATVGIGALYLSDERIDPGLDVYIEGGGGLDVLLDDHLAVGVMFRFEAPTLLRVSYVSVGARVVWRWGH